MDKIIFNVVINGRDYKITEKKCLFSWRPVVCSHKDAKTTKPIFTKFCKVDQYEILPINFGLWFSFVYSIICLKNSSYIDR